MPGCAAIGCNNRSEKGYSMKCFPRDAQLRQEWKKRVGRANWEPSKNSFLCHVHFESNQWTVKSNGRIRLKKDAIPSIFTETSTRKSPRKQRLQNGEQNPIQTTYNRNNMLHIINTNLKEESEDDDYTLEYLDDYDVSYGSKESDTENTTQDNEGLGNTKSSLNCHLTEDAGQDSAIDKKPNYALSYRIVMEKDIKGLEKEHFIIVSDENNREIGKLVHNNESMIIVSDEQNKEIGQIVVGNNLEEQQTSKTDERPSLNIVNVDRPQIKDDYDEIEERLKQICNGDDIPDNPMILEDHQSAGVISASKNICQENEQTLPKNIKMETEQSGVQADREVPMNVKIIFGTESGDESRHTNDSNSPENATEYRISGGNNEVLDGSILKREICGKENSNLKPVDLLDESTLNKVLQQQETSVAPNMRAAMKRKRRTRQEVMRSIERTIANLSDKKLQGAQSDQLTIFGTAREQTSDNREHRSAVRPSQIVHNEFELEDCNSMAKKSRFTIKVSGFADDVNGIIEGLDTASGNTNLQMIRDSDSSSLLDTHKISEIDQKHLLCRDSKFKHSRNWRSGTLKSSYGQLNDSDSLEVEDGWMIREEMDPKYRKTNNKLPFRNSKHATDIDRLFTRNKEFIHTEELHKKMRGISTKKQNGSIKKPYPTLDHDSQLSKHLKYYCKSWNLSSDMQQKIDAQQDVIAKLTNQLIIYKGLETKLAKLNTDLQVKTKEIHKQQTKLQGTMPTCKTEMEMKQKLISNLTNRVSQLEETNKQLMQRIGSNSQDKKLIYHLKQRDDKIKLLNWKLEKASKFLDRAEKNANTYKRKMLSMQTSIRRQKIADAKESHFKELLMNNAKHEFSESALLTAMDIKNSCGIKCYEKLLSHQFPLPSLRTLRRRFQKENVIEDDWGEENQDLVYAEDQNDVTVSEDCPLNETEETEVTGTVQDILEENNDTEDLNSSELGQHIFEQFHIEGTE